MTWEYFNDPRPDIQALVSAPGRRILDVGCGAGALAAALKESGAGFVAGIERDAGAATRARDKVDVLVEGDLSQVALPFVEGEFDYVLFPDVLEHLPDPERALRRYLPLLAEEGRLIVSVPNMRFYAVLLRLVVDRWAYADSGIRDRTHLRVFTRRSLLALLDSVGLEVEELRRRYRLFEDQSRIGRLGAMASRIACATIAPFVFRDLMAFQYIAVSRRRRRNRL